MNTTLKSLLSKGINSEIANNIISGGHSLQSLATCSNEELVKLGVTPDIKNQIFSSGRPDIPEEIIDKLLYKCRRVCCVCRDVTKSIIIHHINEWSISKSNNEENLVVLCLHHHDEAHSKKELSQNLTPDRISAAKVEWEKQVIELDRKLFINSFKENRVITRSLFDLKNKWYNFLKSLGMRIEESEYYDFIIYGKSLIYAKVFEIDTIDELVNAKKLINEFNRNKFLDSLIILGKTPFLSSDGFYGNEINIQIGWIYSYGEGNWDNIMLKNNYDISNSKFYVENLLYENTNYKNFLTDDNYDEIIELWNK